MTVTTEAVPQIEGVKYVTDWSGIIFDQPVPLVERYDLQIGDLVQSSHGYKLLLTDVKHGVERSHVVEIIGHLHGDPEAQTRNERYDGDTTIPVLHRPSAPVRGQFEMVAVPVRPGLSDRCPLVPEGASGFERNEITSAWRNVISYASDAIGRIADVVVTPDVMGETHMMGNDAQRVGQLLAARATLQARLEGVQHRLAIEATLAARLEEMAVDATERAAEIEAGDADTERRRIACEIGKAEAFRLAAEMLRANQWQ